MTRAHLAALLLAATASACSSGSSAPAAGPTVPAGAAHAAPASSPAPAARKLEAETPVKTASGTTFKAPTGWWLSEGKDAVLLEDPEREMRIWMVDIAGGDRTAAIAAAWKRAVPGFALAVAQDQELPGRQGWDAVAQTLYVTKTAESRVVVAVARRKGTSWQIALVDGKQGALGRRGAQLGAIVDSVRVPGMSRESFAGRPAALDEKRLAAFGDFVEEARAMARVPGVAVAVVHGGKIVFQRGYGVRELGKPAAVTPATRFMIGSTTKSLTTLLMARLIDKGAFGWDTPVTKVLPSFALGDAATTSSVTMKHTVCACTGMPRQDLEWIFEFAGWDPERRLASMAAMKPTTGFGETFQYSNLMVSAGGYGAAHGFAPKKKLGPAYDAAMKALVLDPLGMRDTTFDFARATRGNAARPHAQALTLDFVPIGLDLERSTIPVRPAGAAWSTVRDLSRFVMLELARGTLPGGKRLVSEENLLLRRQPQVKVTDDLSYGLGLFVEKDREVAVVGHGGNTFGFTSDLFFLPDHDIGVVVLTNAGGANAFRNAVRRRLLEIVFDGEPEAKDDLAAAMARGEKTLADERALVRAVPDAAWIDPLLGRYQHADLGQVELRRVGDRVVIDVGEWKSDVTEKVDRDGTHKVILTSAPVAGFELVPVDKNGAKVLVLDAGQQVFELARVK
ncbi:MAG TPA: serine hydrolase domain-containing protein [Kofleriaceae bacterium]|nr:serine hydrolase domain-containing protein [Kofleriaceae bacterium]